MRKFFLVGIIALLTACSPATPPAKEEAPAAAETAGPATLGPEGFGPVHIGMTLAEAGAALGRELRPEGLSEDPNACQIYPDSGALYMAQQGRITRISAMESVAGHEAVRTAEGVGVGSSDAEVKSAYPNAEEQPAKYNPPPAHDLIVWTVPNERGIRFEIADGKVTHVHAGDDSILLVEGCS